MEGSSQHGSLHSSYTLQGQYLSSWMTIPSLKPATLWCLLIYWQWNRNAGLYKCEYVCWPWKGGSPSCLQPTQMVLLVEVEHRGFLLQFCHSSPKPPPFLRYTNCASCASFHLHRLLSEPHWIPQSLHFPAPAVCPLLDLFRTPCMKGEWGWELGPSSQCSHFSTTRKVTQTPGLSWCLLTTGWEKTREGQGSKAMLSAESGGNSGAFRAPLIFFSFFFFFSA